ncbi:MAG: DegT/DnrJ/EryC1/StrS family aminotransferase, partial [Bryobacteraceae bacterium]
RRQWEDIRADAAAAFETVGASGWYILGAEVTAFEKALADQWGLAHAVGVASGLDAIELSLKALGCAAGDMVLTTPLSAFATTLAIVKLGAVPIFVDCDRYGLIDLEQCREVLRAQPSIRYLVPVHLYGHSLNLAALRSLRDEFELRIVEDCAQSVLATSDGLPTGSVGQMAATSFYPTKNLGAFGDGGAVLTGEETLAAKVRCLRDYGQSRKYVHAEIGYNSRLDELQSALLRRVQLPRLAAWTAHRRVVAAQYNAGIQHAGIRPMASPRDSNSCWHLYPVVVDPDRKQDFLSWLKSQGVGAGEHYPILMPDQCAMKSVAHQVIRECTQARKIALGEVSLPIHPYLKEEEIERVLDVCNRWSG